MAKIEILKGNMKVAMIDGFVPPYEYFMTKRKILEKKGPSVWGVLHRYSPKCMLSENRLLLFFEALIRNYRLNHCQDNYLFYDNNRPFKCREFTLTTKHNWDSIENTTYRTIFTKYLPVLKHEFRNQELKGLPNYTQNIIIYNPKCKTHKQCAFGWIGNFDFNVKKQSEYLDYKSFKRTWEKILLE